MIRRPLGVMLPHHTAVPSAVGTITIVLRPDHTNPADPSRTPVRRQFRQRTQPGIQEPKIRLLRFRHSGQLGEFGTANAGGTLCGGLAELIERFKQNLEQAIGPEILSSLSSKTEV
jgi:hypothetical protein